MVEISIGITYVHIDHGMHSHQSSVKDVFQQTAEKPYPQSFLFSCHKSEGGSHNHHQIRTDGTDGKGLEYSALKKKTHENYQDGHDLTLQ